MDWLSTIIRFYRINGVALEYLKNVYKIKRSVNTRTDFEECSVKWR